MGGGICYDTGSTNQRNRKGLTYASAWPDPLLIDSDEWAAFKCNMWVTYTPTATGQPTAKRSGGVPHMALNKGVW